MAVKEITDRIPDVHFDLITAKFKRALPKFEKIGNVNVYRLGFGISMLDKLLLPFWGAIFAISLNKKSHYDFFWCLMATFASGAAYIVNILKFLRPIPIVLTIQEGDSEKYLKTKWLGLVDLSWRLALKKSSIVTVISDYLGKRAGRLGYKGEVKIIPNGVDVKKFDIELNFAEKNKIREELGLEEKDIVLVTTSRLVTKNGVGDVIKALPKLPENIKFVIFGEGELKEKLQKLAEDSRVSKRVNFKGLVSHDEMPKYLKACDIFIRASLSEGMGNSFIEAMAAKMPVVATPVGGIADFLKNNETGYFCKSENPESIAEIVKKVIADPNKNQIIENAHKMVLEKYNWDLIAKQMKNVFDNAYEK